MEDFGFDLSGILTEDEATQLFEEQETDDEKKSADPDETENKPAEEDNESSSEEVGEEEVKVEENAIESKDGGSSPSIYSSIASALKNDGIFPDLEDSELEAVDTPEAFAELFEKVINERLDERQKRIDEALGNGVAPDTIKMYEQTLQYLDNIDEDAIKAEDEKGENLRKQLIYNDLVNRGCSDEKAKKELEKSFRLGTDVDDAKDALEALNKFYRDGYKKVQEEAKQKVEAEKAEQKKQAEAFKKMVIDDEVTIGDTKLDKRTRQRVYDAVSKPVYKDPDTGALLTEVQKFQKEKPLEFLKQLGMWFVLTDGGKNIDGFTKEKLRVEKNKGIRELERKINSTALNKDGSLRYTSTTGGDSDPLLSDGWKIGWE